MLKFPTAEDAALYLCYKGYSHLYDVGSCGDHGHGSRLYYCRPICLVNQFGIPTEHATVSYVSGFWYTSIFEFE